MMKRLFLWVITALAATGAWAQNGAWAGSGSYGDPYQIRTADDLRQLAKNVNNGTDYHNMYFQQCADLSLGGSNWTPIGTFGSTGFAGIYDGANFSVTGLSIDSQQDSQGLFGYLNGGTIQNVVLTDCNVSANNQVGTLVGVNSGTVNTCVVRGGIVNVTGSFCNGGGMVGNCLNGTISSSQVTGMSIKSNYSNLGGIAGSAYGSTISECAVMGTTFSEGAHVGAIVGSNDGSLTLRNNLYSTNVSGVKGGCDGKDIIGGAALSNEPIQVMNPKPVEIAVQPMTTLQPMNTAQPSTAAVQTATAQPTAAATATVAQPQMTTTVTTVKPAATPRTSASYIVKTNNVKKPEAKATNAVNTAEAKEEQEEATDFMGKNFRFRTMCEWTPGMRFMVIPEKYDMLVNTFCDANTNKEVSSARLRHKIMVYNGHQDMANGRVHINFKCEDDGKNYYYELPSGTFDDYCFGKMGVPTLAYLDDVDKARELLLDQELITRTEFFRVDTEYDGDGSREVRYPKNRVVKVKEIGVGTRAFPVKIIVEDEEGNQYFQNVAMSKINCGMRDDEFIMDNAKFLFEGSFEFTGADMLVSNDIKSYLNQTVHTKHSTSMSSKGAGKVRDVKVPRYTGFIIDEITPVKDSPYYTLTMRETETRRVYYKDVAFKEVDVQGSDMETYREYYFGYLFGMGEGALRNTSLETRTAIREGRVIPGMSEDEVMMAVGEPFQKLKNSNGIHEWHYARSNGVILVVQFNSKGKVVKAGGRQGSNTKKTTTRKTSSRNSNTRAGGTWENGTPLEYLQGN